MKADDCIIGFEHCKDVNILNELFYRNVLTISNEPFPVIIPKVYFHHIGS